MLVCSCGYKTANFIEFNAHLGITGHTLAESISAGVCVVPSTLLLVCKKLIQDDLNAILLAHTVLCTGELHCDDESRHEIDIHRHVIKSIELILAASNDGN